MAKRYEKSKDQIWKNYRKKKVAEKERILKRELDNFGPLMSGIDQYIARKKELELILWRAEETNYLPVHEAK